MAQLSEEDLKIILGPNYRPGINNAPGFLQSLLDRLSGRAKSPSSSH
jgi:hypothetical protein